MSQCNRKQKHNNYQKRRKLKKREKDKNEWKKDRMEIRIRDLKQNRNNFIRI